MISSTASSAAGIAEQNQASHRVHCRSYLLNELLGPIMFCTFFACTVCINNAAAAAGAVLTLPVVGSFTPVLLSAAWEPYSLVGGPAGCSSTSQHSVRGSGL